MLLDKKQQDKSYNTMAEDLAAVGVPVTLIDNQSAADATMHNKFTVIDGRRVLTGSLNYSTTAMNRSEEELLIIDDAGIAELFENEFLELLAGGEARGQLFLEDFLFLRNVFQMYPKTPSPRHGKLYRHDEGPTKP